MEHGQHDLGTILGAVKNGTELTESHIKAILYNTLCGLAFMHNLGVLHRDIKPNNILIRENCSIQIIDFGLSRSKPKGNKLMRLYRHKYMDVINDQSEQQHAATI